MREQIQVNEALSREVTQTFSFLPYFSMEVNGLTSIEKYGRNEKRLSYFP